MLEVLEALGFSTEWRNWISAILATSTSKVLMNGQRAWQEFQTRPRPQTGDPLSPLLFILAIHPLQRLVEIAAQRGVLQLVLPRAANLKCSLYADDVAIFAAPTPSDLRCLQKILSFFTECSGLKINFSKTEILLIRMENISIEQVLQNFPGRICKFPC